MMRLVNGSKRTIKNEEQSNSHDARSRQTHHSTPNKLIEQIQSPQMQFNWNWMFVFYCFFRRHRRHRNTSHCGTLHCILHSFRIYLHSTADLHSRLIVRLYEIQLCCCLFARTTTRLFTIQVLHIEVYACV